MTTENVETEQKKKSQEEIDFEARLMDDDFDDEDSEELYVDNTLLQIREARALIRMWHDMNTQLVEIKTGFRMAKKWDDQELKDRYLDAGKPLIKKVDILENSLREALEPLKNVPFLEEQEIRILPRWVHKILGISIPNLECNFLRSISNLL